MGGDGILVTLPIVVAPLVHVAKADAILLAINLGKRD